MSCSSLNTCNIGSCRMNQELLPPLPPNPYSSLPQFLNKSTFDIKTVQAAAKSFSQDFSYNSIAEAYQRRNKFSQSGRTAFFLWETSANDQRRNFVWLLDSSEMQVETSVPSAMHHCGSICKTHLMWVDWLLLGWVGYQGEAAEIPQPREDLLLSLQLAFFSAPLFIFLLFLLSPPGPTCHGYAWERG